MAVAPEPGQDGGAGPGDLGEDDRPSFEDFWKRNKESHQAKNVTFLPTAGVGM